VIKNGLFVVAMAAVIAFLIHGAGNIEIVSGEEIILGEQDGWQVIRGMAPLEGQERAIGRDELLKGKLLIVNAEHPLPPDFPSPNVRAVRAMVGAYLPAKDDTLLGEEAIYSLCDMKLSYCLDSGVTFGAGAVSAAQQEERRRGAYDRYSRVYPLMEAMQLACAAIPGGGMSEHQTGYALDIELHPPLSMGYAHPLKRNTVGRWIYENMWKFGWIDRSRMEEGGECDGIHIRYVGRIHAAAMHALGVGLEDYWNVLRKEENIVLSYGGEVYAVIVCGRMSEQYEITLPEGRAYDASSDNMGWAAAAIEIRKMPDHPSVSGSMAIH